MLIFFNCYVINIEFVIDIVIWDEYLLSLFVEKWWDVIWILIELFWMLWDVREILSLCWMLWDVREIFIEFVLMLWDISRIFLSIWIFIEFDLRIIVGNDFYKR